MSLRTQNTCKGSPKTHRIDKTVTTRNNQEKDRTTASTIKVSKENSIIRRKADTKTSK